jgi:hypothetical protein
MKNEKVLQELEIEYATILNKKGNLLNTPIPYFFFFINSFQFKGVDAITNDDYLLAMTTAANRSMKVQSGKEAMKVSIDFAHCNYLTEAPVPKLACFH